MKEFGHCFEIAEESAYGVVLRCTDADIADRFEDFLSEEAFVLFNVRFESAAVAFFFGQASSVDAVQGLVARFQSAERSKT